MKETKDLSPLFNQYEIKEENNVEIIEINLNNKEKGKLYECD